MDTKGMIGADIGRLRALASEFTTGADRIDGDLRAVTASMRNTPWQGATADRFRQSWTSVHSTRLRSLSTQLRDAARILRVNADEQERVSNGGSSIGSRSAAAAGAVCALRTGMHTGGTHRTSFAFADYISRIEDVADENAFEILQVSSDPPKYIVLLPGIEVEGWFDSWDTDSIRDLQNAVTGRLLQRDVYAARVAYELQRAGVPAGSEVMLMGHSYGAIAAMNLASDDQFNQPGNASADGAYHVQVTHVVAAGAGVRDWMGRPPDGTNVLLSINRADHVATAIQAGGGQSLADLRVLDESPGFVRMVAERGEHVFFGGVHSSAHEVSPGRVVHEFTAGNDRSGHHYDNYRTGLSSSGDPALSSWEDDAAREYFVGNPEMVSTRVQVFDQAGGVGGGTR